MGAGRAGDYCRKSPRLIRNRINKGLKEKIPKSSKYSWAVLALLVIRIWKLHSTEWRSSLKPHAWHAGCRASDFIPFGFLSTDAAVSSKATPSQSSSINDISSMSTEHTLASDTDSSLDASTGPLEGCRWNLGDGALVCEGFWLPWPWAHGSWWNQIKKLHVLHVRNTMPCPRSVPIGLPA